MSNRAITWAFAQPIDTVPKFVLVVLADMADERDSCYPARSYIEGATGASRSTVQRSLRDLEAAGFITRQQRARPNGSGTSNRYFLHVDGGVDNPEPM